MQLFTLQDIDWLTGDIWIVDYCNVFMFVPHSDGTHSLQRICEQVIPLEW